MRFAKQVVMPTVAAGFFLSSRAAVPEPQTAGIRSRLVRLKPGKAVGWHTTGKHEESLIILHGRGEALIDGQQKRALVAPAFVYITPSTRHNVLNTGKDELEYVYVVAPVTK